MHGQRSGYGRPTITPPLGSFAYPGSVGHRHRSSTWLRHGIGSRFVLTHLCRTVLDAASLEDAGKAMPSCDRSAKGADGFRWLNSVTREGMNNQPSCIFCFWLVVRLFSSGISPHVCWNTWTQSPVNFCSHALLNTLLQNIAYFFRQSLFQRMTIWKD